jgi:hypothetical protein
MESSDNVGLKVAAESFLRHLLCIVCFDEVVSDMFDN